MSSEIKVLDHGYVRFIEAWGHGDAGVESVDLALPVGEHGEVRSVDYPTDFECGIIEAARQSTQASFRGWEDRDCPTCQGMPASYLHSHSGPCPTCNGSGIERGDQRLLNYLFSGKPQHATPFEFSGMTIEVQGPIFVFREWHRHRTQSYNEMSARYAPLPDLNYIPTRDRLLVNGGKNKQAGVVKGAGRLDEAGAEAFRKDLRLQYEQAEATYQAALSAGVPKELARCVLPVGRYSRMRATANLRNWLAFVTLRSDPMAQYEIRQYSQAVETIIAEKFPRTYELFLKRRSTNA